MCRKGRDKLPRFSREFMTNADGTPHPVDSPVERAAQPPIPTNGSARLNGGSNSSMATPAQLKLIYLSGTRDAHLTEEEVEERCRDRYGREPMRLTKREASELIASFKAVAAARA